MNGVKHRKTLTQFSIRSRKASPNDSMEQSPSLEADNGFAGQNMPILLWNPKVYYGVQNSPPLDPVLGQMNPAHMSHPV